MSTLILQLIYAKMHVRLITILTLLLQPALLATMLVITVQLLLFQLLAHNVKLGFKDIS